MIRFKCPHCEAKMEVDETNAGRMARCATCGQDLKIPRQSETTPRASTPVRPGATTVKVEGEHVEVVPPVETTAYIGVGAVAVSVIAFLAAWMSGTLTPPFAVGATIGSLVAALGAMVGLSAWNTIRRSRGRRGGAMLAKIALIGGGSLFFLFALGAIIGYAKYHYRPTCKENLQHINAALRDYASKHDGVYPPNLMTLVEEHNLDKRDWLTCPAYAAIPGTQTYGYITQLTINPKYYPSIFPTNMLVAYDGPEFNTHGDGFVRVLLLDGTIEKKPLTDWAKFFDTEGRLWQDVQRKVRIAQGLIAPPAPTPTQETIIIYEEEAPTGTGPAATATGAKAPAATPTGAPAAKAPPAKAPATSTAAPGTK
jgi:hypothetical protein